MGKEILIACNEDVISELFSWMTGMRFYTIFPASNLERAVKILKENKNISLIVADYSLPTMIGIRLLDVIKKNKERRVPFIGVASCRYWADRFRIAGADDFYCFIDNPQKLLGKIETLIGG